MNPSAVLGLVLCLVLCLNIILVYHTGMTRATIMEDEDLIMRRYDADLVDCQNVSEITFLGLFPCLRNTSSFEASDNISECDLLVEAAARLAVERVNQNPNILHNITLKLYPIYVPNRRESHARYHYDMLVQILDLLHSNDSDSVWGIIGPGNNPDVTNFMTSLAENSGLITVSYGSTVKDDADKVPIFYRTLPSNMAANFGRLVLLEKHKWYRIGILKSAKEEYYLQECSQFVSIFNEYIEKEIFKVNLDVTESFSDSPTAALRSIMSRDINIIIGFFGPDNARRVLCQADDINLATDKHAWVLPSYYDPNWWRSPNNTDCSDEEMKKILESVIFIDNIKLPPAELTIDDFYSSLVAKALYLFPSLTEEDLKPYLLRSRATNAYDAVTLLARSVGVAFDHGGDSCTDTSMVQVLLEGFLTCEYCQLHSAFSECFNLDTLFDGCKSNSSSFKITSEVDLFLYQCHNGSKPDYLRDTYGQILYSQFQGGEECPIILWWPGLGEKHYKKGYLLIDEFDDETRCLSRHMSLSRRNFVSNNSNCSKKFHWRGSLNPPNSNFLETFSIPISALIIIGISVFIGLGVAILLVIFNVCWRKNKIIKATSPWLNVLLLVGIMIRLPSTLYYGLIFSANSYAGLIDKDLTPLCHVTLWQYYIGDALFVATLIAKNWRIYRIFFNKGLKQMGNKLEDNILIIGILLTMCPLIVILIVWSAKGVDFETYSFQNENLQIINITTCYYIKDIIFDLVANSYILILYLFLFVLSLLTASVPSSTFRRQGVGTYKAVVFALLPTLFVFLTRIVVLVSRNPDLFDALLWIEFFWTSVLPFILLQVLFAPTIYAVLRRHINEKHAISEEREHRRITLKYNDLRHDADALKLQLEQLDDKILKMKAELMPRTTTEPNRTDSNKAEKCSRETADPIDCTDEVDLVSMTVTKSLLVPDCSKTGEQSNTKIHCTTEMLVVSFRSPGGTIQTPGDLPAIASSPAFDRSSPSSHNKTASDLYCSSQCNIDLVRTSEDEEGCHILCTLDHTEDTCRGSHLVTAATVSTSEEANLKTIICPSKETIANS